MLHPHILLAFGLTTRVWAAGFIGTSAREYPFKTRFRVTSGPYRYLRHPLYIGNFFLVLGVLLLFNSPLWFCGIVIALFVLVYSLISMSESDYIRGLESKKTRFQVRNLRAEISTVTVVALVYVIYMAWRYIYQY